MIESAIGVFALAAILGIMLLTFVLKGKHTPKALVFIHGPLAIVGLILLAVYCLKEYPRPMESLILFIIAAMGGLFLVIRDLMGKTIPKWLAVVHGLIAVGGFVLLLMFRFG